MIIVTGGAGFIGSNLTRSLAGDGHAITVVDDADPTTNLTDVPLADVIGQNEFLARMSSPSVALRGVDAVLHQGACSSTTETDGEFLWANNVEYSMRIHEACTSAGVRMVHASSAAVYGDGPFGDADQVPLSRPRNAYARSKALFDQYLQRRLASGIGHGTVSLRYFNVYGPSEGHKGPMASMVHQGAVQLAESGSIRLFGEGAGMGAGQHRRDFVHVDDVVAVIRWFADNGVSGVFNCGTGTSRTFSDLAEVVIGGHGSGAIDFIPFPCWLEGAYQAETRADLTRLREAGCDVEFSPLEVGVPAMLADPRGPWGGDA